MMAWWTSTTWRSPIVPRGHRDGNGVDQVAAALVAAADPLVAATGRAKNRSSAAPARADTTSSRSATTPTDRRGAHRDLESRLRTHDFSDLPRPALRRTVSRAR